MFTGYSQRDEISGDAVDVSAPSDRNARARELRADRQQRGECVRGCGQQAAPDSDYCAPCRVKVRRTDAERQKQLRALRRQRGECAYCGAPSKRRRCDDCWSADGRTPRGVTEGVQRATQQQFHTEGAGRKPKQVWRTEYDGRRRRRNVGQGRRGAPSREATDEWDLRAMETEISRARSELQAFYSDENQQLPRIQRDAAKRSALGHLELLQRFVTELVDRTRKGLR